MKTLLKIDASPRTYNDPDEHHQSVTRQYGAHFTDLWMKINHQSRIIERDLYQAPPPFITQDWITAAFTPETEHTAKQQDVLAMSNRLYEEVRQADVIVITTPMYNYGMPAILKAWFDQLLRLNHTFSFDLTRGDFPVATILTGKTVVLLCSCGEFGFGPGEIRADMNHLGPHIQMLSRFLGAGSFYEIRSEYQEFKDRRFMDSVASARQSIAALVTELSVE